MAQPEPPSLPDARTASFFFHRQWLHVGVLAVLVPLAWAFAAPALGDGAWLGVSDSAWFWASVCIAVVHQAIVAAVFRAQLGWSIFTRWFGKADLFVWGVLFLPLLIARPLTVLGLAVADAGSAAFPQWLGIAVGALLMLPAVYAMYSTFRYFGIVRAMGADHFRPEYREMPLVNEGAFRYSNNAMYAFVFLGFWGIGFLAGSLAALAAALFQHVYIWAHYYCTEEPDMKLLYG